jgi:hypothetical protein
MDVSAVASGNGTSSITLTATANAGITGVDAGSEPTIGYTNTTGSIVDGSANERTTISAATFEDGAAPAAVSQNYKDTNNDGQIDRVDVTFSELIEQNECESADFSFGSTDAGSIAVASCAISSNDLRLTISNAPAQDTNLDLTWSYDASNGTANSLDDSDGNGTGDQTGKTLADAAAPLLISSSPADSATDVANDADVVLTFTEPMDTGSVTYTYTNYTGGATGVWSSGNSVLTLTPDGTYDSESSITFEITAADDPTGNSMTNTVSTHPFSFTVVAYSSGGSTGSLYVEKAGQYTSIKIYDASDLTTPLTAVTPGQSVSIVWVHNGNITTTELYYQTEEMNTSSTLIDLVTDGGTQSDLNVEDRLEEHAFGVDLERFKPGEEDALKEDLGIKKKTPVLLFVGGLDAAHAFKGVQEMIEALEQIKQHDWHLVIVGDGNLKETYRANAEANGLADRITFAGSVSNEDLPRYYRMADMHLFPSTKRAEAFGLVAMEAAASGVPSIASDLPGVRTVVLDGDTGLLVPPANVEELKNAILLLLEQVDLRERLGLSARKQAEQRYAWEPLIDRLEETYASVLNQQSERNYDV